METKRLFIATFVAQHLFKRHYDNILSLFSNSCNGKWTELNNLHFTYKFLGNVQVEKIEELKELLSDTLIDYNSILKFNGLGSINSHAGPNLLYARVHSPDKSVMNNFFEIEKRLVKYGFQKERRKFLAHITMLRIKNSNDTFGDVFEQNKDFYIGKQQNYKISLVSSTLTHDGPIYEILL